MNASNLEKSIFQIRNLKYSHIIRVVKRRYSRIYLFFNFFIKETAIPITNNKEYKPRRKIPPPNLPTGIKPQIGKNPANGTSTSKHKDIFVHTLIFKKFVQNNKYITPIRRKSIPVPTYS